MKTLIVYGTTYGYAQECAHTLKSLLRGDVEAVDAKNALTLSLASFDQVVIGSSVYMGQVQKSVKKFCALRKEELMDKRLGLFLCCGSPESFSQTLATAFPEELRKQFISTECFGGRIDPSKMNLLHRTIMRMITKSAASGKTPSIIECPENIQKMAQDFASRAH